VLVRNLEEGVVAAIKARAAAHGRSLEQELRLILAAAATPTPTEIRQTAAAIRSLTGSRLETDLEALVREDRGR